MNQERRITYAFLAAAVKHADGQEQVADKFGLVLYFLNGLASDLYQTRRYTHALTAKTLIRRIRADNAVNPIWKELRAEVAAAKVVEEIPASNTGITPADLQTLEEYI
jgi:hypothetical protein